MLLVSYVREKNLFDHESSCNTTSFLIYFLFIFRAKTSRTDVCKNCVDYLAPTLSREGHYHTIQTPSAGEGEDRSKLKNPCSDQIQMMFKKTSGTLPIKNFNYLKHNEYPYWSLLQCFAKNIHVLLCNKRLD